MGIVVVLLFVVLMLLMGFIAMRKTKSVSDFFLAGRGLGPWLSAFAYGTTYFSAVLFIGYGGKLGWGFGLHTMWIVLGNALVGSLLAWWILGKRTREMTERLNAMTMPSFLAERYGSPFLKVLAAVLIFVFLVPYSASVYKGLNYLFQEALILNESQALLLLAGLTGIYLVMGGYLAVTLTDFIMGLMMIFGVVALITFLTGSGGGIVHTTKMLLDTQRCSPALKAASQIPGWLTLLSLVIVTSFGPWGLPQMVQKFYSIKSGDQVKRAMIVATLFALLVTFGGYYTGALTHVNISPHPKAIRHDIILAEENGYTAVSQLPIRLGADGKPVVLPNGRVDVVWDRWVPTYLAHRLPPWLMLVIVLLVLSASMSTLSSLVLVSSSAIAMDLYAGVVNPRLERRSVLVLMRLLCAIFVALSLVLAKVSISHIVTLMVISWGVLAGAFAAPYLYGLFWRRATLAGALAGMAVAVVGGAGLAWLLGEPGITPNDPAIPVASAVSILLPFVIVPLASILGSPPDKRVVDKAFGLHGKKFAESGSGVVVK
jgi:SSS family transporter